MTEPKNTVRGWSPAPKAQSLLLPAGTEIPDYGGGNGSAIGTGILICVGTARSAKTLSLMLPLVEWALLASDDRRAAFVEMPPAFMEALPESVRRRSDSVQIEDLPRLRDSIVCIDDCGVHLNARDSSSGMNRLLNRLAGVISHLQLTLIICVQSMAGVDVSLMRFCELAPLVKRIDPMALNHERSEWAPSLREAQFALKAEGYDRSLYWSVADSMLCRAPWPEWCRPDPEHPERHDALSMPFRYMTQERLDELMSGRRGGAE